MPRSINEIAQRYARFPSPAGQKLSDDNQEDPQIQDSFDNTDHAGKRALARYDGPSTHFDIDPQLQEDPDRGGPGQGLERCRGV